MSMRTLPRRRRRTTWVDLEARAAQVNIIVRCFLGRADCGCRYLYSEIRWAIIRATGPGGRHESSSRAARRPGAIDRGKAASSGGAGQAGRDPARAQSRSLRRLERAVPPRARQGLLRAGRHRRDDVALEERDRRDPPRRLRRVRFRGHRRPRGDARGDARRGAIAVSQRMLRDERDRVAGMVRACARGWRDAIRNPREAVDSLAKVDPRIDRATEIARFEWIRERQVLTPAVRANGLGMIDLARVRRLATQIAAPGAQAFAVERVFDGSFLPALADRSA